MACLYEWDRTNGVTSEKCSVKESTTGQITLDDIVFNINKVVINQLQAKPKVSYKGTASLAPKTGQSSTMEEGVTFDFSMNYLNSEAHSFSPESEFYNVEVSV